MQTVINGKSISERLLTNCWAISGPDGVPVNNHSPAHATPGLHKVVSSSPFRQGMNTLFTAIAKTTRVFFL